MIKELGVGIRGYGRGIGYRCTLLSGLDSNEYDQAPLCDASSSAH